MKAKDIKAGDVFIYQGKESVAIEDYTNHCLWVTVRDRYIPKKQLDELSYGYTSATVIVLNKYDEVEFIKNMEDSNISSSL